MGRGLRMQAYLRPCNKLEYVPDASVEPVNPPALSDEPPWHLKACSVDTSLINYGRKQDNPYSSSKPWHQKNTQLQQFCSYLAYTDASKTTDNETSAAFCIPELNIEHSVRLNNKCNDISIFAAELSAIKLALLWVIGNSDKTSAYLVIHIDACKLYSIGKSICIPNLLLLHIPKMLTLCGSPATLASKEMNYSRYTSQCFYSEVWY